MSADFPSSIQGDFERLTIACLVTFEPGKPTPYTIAVDGAFGEGTYYDASDADRFGADLTLPGLPANTLVLRR